MSEDPARDGENWYGYCNENPLKFVDPTGLEVEESKVTEAFSSWQSSRDKSLWNADFDVKVWMENQAVGDKGRIPNIDEANAYAASAIAGQALYGAVGGFAIGLASAYRQSGSLTAEELNTVPKGAKDAPLQRTRKTTKEWIYGPEKDKKILADGSTDKKIWTTPDRFTNQKTATDKLDPFKPLEGRRRVTIPKGTEVQRGITPGKEGPYNANGGANETFIPDGLPSGSVGPWKPFKSWSLFQ